MRNGFGSGKPPNKEHLDLLDRRVFEHFLLDLDPLLQGLEEVDGA